MPENLIQHITAIEQEADKIIQKAHDDAAAQDREAQRRIEQLQAELEKQYLEQVQTITGQINKEREAQQKELKERFSAALAAVRNIKVDESKALIDRVVERISNS
ncbi:MAG TPA: hypothetical protein VM141_04375 [Planctomycetota bacterium]|nr:hypothetical protein [Planctomycetota bacterium]